MKQSKTTCHFSGVLWRTQLRHWLRRSWKTRWQKSSEEKARSREIYNDNTTMSNFSFLYLATSETDKALCSPCSPGFRKTGAADSPWWSPGTWGCSSSAAGPSAGCRRQGARPSWLPPGAAAGCEGWWWHKIGPTPLASCASKTTGGQWGQDVLLLCSEFVSSSI